MIITHIIIICVIFFLLFLTEKFNNESAQTSQPYECDTYIEKFTVPSRYISEFNRDQDGQSIQKYQNNQSECKLDCDKRADCAGMVTNGNDCWTIKSFPNTYYRRGSVSHRKDLCDTNLNTRTSERDTCNTNLNTRTSERDTCNTNLTERTGERDTCNTNLNIRTEERDTCNSVLINLDALTTERYMEMQRRVRTPVPPQETQLTQSSTGVVIYLI